MREVLCLNTDPQLTAATAGSAHTSKRGRSDEKERVDEVLCLNTDLTHPVEKMRQRNRTPESKRKAESRRGHGDARSTFFFLRLPTGQYGPVSQLSRSEESCTGPFNWGEAHCAGEKVKRKIGPFQWKSL